ncbi:VPLPA-CTERM sorting domain-containing protein [Pseudomonadota bacterium]
MAKLLHLTIAASLFVVTPLQANLVGDRIDFCVSPISSLTPCTAGFRDVSFSATVSESVVEFPSLPLTDEPRESFVDFTGTNFTILMDWSRTDLAGHTFTAHEWLFEDLEWSGIGGEVIDVTQVIDGGLPVDSIIFGPSWILITTNRITIPRSVLTASFYIETQPVPIPSALYLFGTGLIGLIGMARRKVVQ